MIVVPESMWLVDCAHAIDEPFTIVCIHDNYAATGDVVKLSCSVFC